VWIFRGIIFVILLVVLVWFFVDNSNQSVDIKFFTKSYLDISIYWVVVISFLVGFVASLVLALVREFRLRGEITRLRRQALAKDREIADLRTLPLRQSHADESDDTTTGDRGGE
jgi:uncharacterized integral membrane protein